MANSSMLVNAGEMAAALAIVVPKARSKTVKPHPITINYAKSVATVTEAQYGLRAQQLPATGKWAGRVQVDGRRLRKVFDVLSADAQVELTAATAELVIVMGKTQIRMPCLDLDGDFAQGLLLQGLDAPAGIKEEESRRRHGRRHDPGHQVDHDGVSLPFPAPVQPEPEAAVLVGQPARAAR